MRHVVSSAVLLCGLVAFAGAVAAPAAEPPGTARRAPIPLPAQPGPHRCVTRPVVKEVKKTVYETKLVPYCLPRPWCGVCRGDGRRPCPDCEKCVRWKRVVVKREVVVGETCCYACTAEECFPKSGPSAGSLVPPAPSSMPPGTPPAHP
ncbi:MAG TPA: hypothetical protein VF170_02140 [Planctomycetaceae bacterium]